jgi:tetratricopeptide (TPR) repeat protein
VTAQIQASPGCADLYLKRADLFFHHEDWSSAVADYDRAEKLNPSLDAVHAGRGKLLLAAGRFDEAKSEIDRFLSGNPANAEALMIRGRIEVALGRPLPAAADFANAIKCSQQPEPDFYIEQARALALAGDAHIGEAIDVLNKGSATLGDLPGLGLYAVELEVRLKRFDAALARIGRLSARSARQESWLERSGDIQILAGRRSEAVECFGRAREAIARLPENVRTTKAVRNRESSLTHKLRALGMALH